MESYIFGFILRLYLLLLLVTISFFLVWINVSILILSDNLLFTWPSLPYIPDISVTVVETERTINFELILISFYFA